MQAKDVEAVETRELYVDGAWVPATDGQTHEVHDPGTGKVIAHAASAGENDVDRAVAAARRSFDDGAWRRSPTRRRARVLLQIAGAIDSQRDRLARLETLDCGKPLAEAVDDIAEAVFLFEYYAGLITSGADLLPPTGPEALSLVLREPVGVSALITPWNYPLLMAAQKVAPALAAGCSVILKPAEQTPLTALELASLIADSALPPGVFNLLTGFGEPAGATLAAHPAVDKVSFTGSVAVGQSVLRSSIERLARVTLELGGKSPNIVFGDADLSRAIPGTAAGIFLNQGEVCSAGSRLLVHDSLHDQLIEGLAKIVESYQLGHGLDPTTTMGPLISSEQRERVLGYLDVGRSEGAQVAVAGNLPTDPTCAGGWFVAPTVLDDVTSEMTVAREEIFGPVLTVQCFSNFEQAIAMANDSDYGLAAAIWTEDPATAMSAAREVRAGTVWINDSQPAPSEAPWGGFKRSGIGRELGPSGLAEYQELKHVYWRIAR